MELIESLELILRKLLEPGAKINEKCVLLLSEFLSGLSGKFYKIWMTFYSYNFNKYITQQSIVKQLSDIDRYYP